MEWNEEFTTRWKKIVDSDAEFTKRNEEEFLNGNAPAAQKELFLKCKAVVQPYIDRMNADPLNSQNVELQAELNAKIQAITWEYTLRQDAMNH
jgi:hypothetical protein